ncbi:MAG: 16S rRNA (cytosine(1402)-N(4))-methyltransferase RsmH [Erysipelotrichaceae bacterium]|nr:16S rRNA (cytosine(1402)-N(4))-methyltransferase RsmH [Erysipelotrichaceae bacterium]
MEHVSVMLQQCLDALAIREDGIYVDGTLGRGGHACAIASRLTGGKLYCFDLDRQAIEESEEKLAATGADYELICSNFIFMKDELNKRGVEEVDGILLDLGVSSPQFDDPSRGFSYRYDSRLDMRMDQSQTLDAWQIVNNYSFQDLVRILREYGEEKYAVNIARKIEQTRAEKPIDTTGQLVDIIRQALPARELNKKGHPAKQTFQALRIEVNHELDNLRAVIDQGLQLLKPQGRLAVITFHSLEDEIVKKAFRAACQSEQVDKRIPLKESEIRQAEYQLVNRKVITADERELEENHRSHSAKLRVIERRTRR